MEPLKNWLQQQWYRDKKPAWFLRFLSYGYRLVVALRQAAYRYHVFKVHRLPVPVIVVGNLTVGGNGKTPLVISLCHYLRQQGFKPGVISRGYGRQDKKVRAVSAQSDPIQVGDEALLIYQQTQCPVVVAPKRIDAAKALLAQQEVDIILSDDGLQHAALGRDLEVVVVDDKRRFGNGYCLPAGPLREPLSRLERVDMVVYKGGRECEQHNLQLIPKQFRQLSSGQVAPCQQFRNQAVQAMAAIGNPRSFFSTLDKLCHQVRCYPKPDHAPLRPIDFKDLRLDQPIIITDKDAVKCKIDELPENVWVLEVAPYFDKQSCDHLVEELMRSFYGCRFTRNSCLPNL